MRQNTRPSPFRLTGNVFGGLLAGCCVMILIGAVAPLSQPLSGKPGEPLCRSCATQSFSIREKQGQHFTLTVHFNEYRWGVTGTHWYLGFPVLVEYNDSRL